MIVRILGEGQFRADEALVKELNRIDNRLVAHVEKGDQRSFQNDLRELISLVRTRGEPIDPVDLLPSSIIVPPEDLSLDEARRVFRGAGLIEDTA